MIDMSIKALRLMLERGKYSELKKAIEIVSTEIDKEILRKAGDLVKYTNGSNITTIISVLKELSIVDLKIDRQFWNQRLLELQECQLQKGDIEIVMQELDRRWKRYRYLKLSETCEYAIKDKPEDRETVRKARLLIEDIDRGLFEQDDRAVTYGVLDTVMRRIWSEVDQSDVIYSGFRTIDTMIGGIRRSTLSIVLAGTSVGKTSFMVYMSGMAMLQGYNVLYVTLEDLKEVIERRIDKFLLGESLKNDMESKIELLKSNGANIYVSYLSIAGVSDIERLLDAYKEAGIDIDVLVIDYGDLLKSDKKEEEFIEVGRIFQNLMRVGVDRKIWVVSGSQAVRSAMKTKALGLEHTSRSFRKVEVAHYVIGLMASNDEEAKNQVRVSVLKNKFGVKGMTVSCNVDWGRCVFKEVEG